MAQISNSNALGASDAHATLSAGAMIGGRFEVIQMTRRDFVGSVYLARDGRSQRDVECLLINLNREDNYRLLELRAHIHEVKQLRLKSFASTYGIGKQGNDGYVVRQTIEGRPLTDHLNHRSQHHRPFKQRGLCSLLIEVIQALEALRDQELEVKAHGLIRPSVMMIQNQQKPRVRLTDIGIGLIRDTLVKQSEYDPWTRGCIPELRGESSPVDPDLYAIGALLFQMTQLRPFTQGWLRELSTSPTFTQLPDLIEACTASHPMITLTDLKNELKYAAQAQVELGGLTKDLSHLQERLQKIIDYESESEAQESGAEPEAMPQAPLKGAPEPVADSEDRAGHDVASSLEAIAPEESVSVIFHQLPEREDSHALSEHVPLQITPPPEELFKHADVDSPVSTRENLISAPTSMRAPSVEDYELSGLESQLSEPAERDQVSSIAANSADLILTESVETSETVGSIEVDMSALNNMMNMLNEDVEDESEAGIQEVGSTVSAEPLVPEEREMSKPESELADSARSALEQTSDDADGHLEVFERVDTLHGADIEEIESELYSSAEHIDVSAYQKSGVQPPTLNVAPEERAQVEAPLPNLMDLPLPSLPSPVQSDLPTDDDLDGRRWIVMRDGKDYGPYTLDELSKQLFREEIDLDTEIWDIETDERALLGEFSSLDGVLNEWAKERIVRRKLREERARRAKARRRLTIVVALIALGGAVFAGVNYGPEIKAAMLPKPASIQLNTWITPPPVMQKLNRMEESPAKRAERRRLARQQRVREETLRTSREMSREARLASSATNVDFNRKGAKRASFSQSEFNRVLGTRQARLLKCIEAESQRAPNRSIFKVTLTVQQSGNFINAQLLNGTSQGKRCVFKAIRKLKMTPFSGGDKTITLPYQFK